MSQIALSQLGWRNKVVITPDDPGFPGKSMYDAAADLERRYKKTLLLINSGSGYSDDPLVMAQDLARYIEEKENFQVHNRPVNVEFRVAVGSDNPAVWPCSAG